jgi:hypothetical protein
MPDLEKAVEHLAFETYHFRSYGKMRKSSSWSSFHPSFRQAVITALLVHLRVLLDFFYKASTRDDCHVDCFCQSRPFAERFAPAPSPEATEVFDELSKRLVHLTEVRWLKNAPLMSYYEDYSGGIEALIVRFEDALPPDLRQIYDQAQEHWLSAHPPAF